MQIYSPEGAVGAAPHAPTASPAVLTGLRVAVLDNGKPNARLLLERLADRLAERAGATVSLVVAKGTAATPAEPEVLDALREGADLVVTGSAD
jgi:nucleotide-binding universal stress UspA family protein